MSRFLEDFAECIKSNNGRVIMLIQMILTLRVLRRNIMDKY